MIVPARRLWFIAAAGTIPIALSGSADLAVAVAAIWLALCAVITAVDALLTSASRELHWEREHDERLSLGARNPVNLALTNRSKRAVTLRVREVTPPLFRARGQEGEGICPPGQAWTLAYDVLPLRRGDYALGPAVARYLGPLGLAWRQRRVLAAEPVTVYPNVRAVSQYDALLARGRLTEIGIRASRRLGEGTAFSRLRPYSPDDEYRRVNWKATARAGAPIVADYEAERSQSIILALDVGRLMGLRLPLELPDDDRPIALTRLDYALNASVLLAHVATEYGDRVGLLAFSDLVARYRPPRPGRRQFLAITGALYNLEPGPTATDPRVAMAALAAHHAPRSLLVLFTDLADADAAIRLVPPIVQLGRRHLVLVVTLRDPEIERLASGIVEGTEAVYERAVARELLEERDAVLAELRSRGVLTLDVPADRISAGVINRYLEIKERGRL